MVNTKDYVSQILASLITIMDFNPKPEQKVYVDKLAAHNAEHATEHVKKNPVGVECSFVILPKHFLSTASKLLFTT